MKRTLCVILAAALILFAFAACGEKTPTEEPGTTAAADAEVTTAEAVSETKDPEAVNVTVLKGPTGMGMAYLMSQNEAGASANKYNFTIETAPDVVSSQLISGEADIAAIPSNAAAALWNKTGGKIKIVASNTYNVLRVLTNDDGISDFDDLRGRTVYCSGEGTTVQYFIEKIFAEKGLKVGEDVTIEYAAEHSETVTLAKQGKADTVILPEPFATQLLMGEESYRQAFDLNAAIEELGLPIVMGVYAVRTEFAEKYPEKVRAFVEQDAKQSHEMLLNDTDAVAQLIEQYDIMKAAVAKASVPNCAIVYKYGDEMTERLDALFKMLYEVNPQSVGGNVPDETVYFK